MISVFQAFLLSGRLTPMSKMESRRSMLTRSDMTLVYHLRADVSLQRPLHDFGEGPTGRKSMSTSFDAAGATATLERSVVK